MHLPNIQSHKITGFAGAAIGTIACLVALSQQVSFLTTNSIVIYLCVPLLLVMLVFFLSRARIKPHIAIVSINLVGLLTFLYGLFILVLYKHVA